VYTRKSTEEGLEQAFNSLEAQRDSAAAYIASQRAHGWALSAERYDDGGFSGASLDRPALRRLLADVEAGRVDSVVVYKVDRLSRSLLDFARIMGVLERRGVGFVSVTQQFNTATPLGRLTLHLLFSFAEFERELARERTRDKMGAARRQGRWTGGCPVLGYDVGRAGAGLAVNGEEAERVRAIFECYVSTRSVTTTLAELERRGWRNKAWRTRAGRERGGLAFTRYTLRHLLSNATYVGVTRQQGQWYAGEHAAIVDRALFDAAQPLLEVKEPAAPRPPRRRPEALLGGLLFCARCGSAMTFRRLPNARAYYTCGSEAAAGARACRAARLAADQVEVSVIERVGAVHPLREPVEARQLQAVIQRIEYDAADEHIRIVLRRCATEAGTQA
jgi:site-specific DNA recombinase